MIEFQLDECMNSRRLCDDCNAAAKSFIRRFPAKFRGQGIKDPVVIAEFAGKTTLLTSDLAMLAEHAAHIPPFHKGIVVLGHSAATLRTATAADHRMIIEQFKKACPTWNAFDFSNSVTLITERYVQVFHLADGGSPVRDGHFEFSDADWTTKLQDALMTNAARAPV